MKLSNYTIYELRETMKKEYGVRLTPSEATEQAHKLVAYFDLLISYLLEDGNHNDKKY